MRFAESCGTGYIFTHINTILQCIFSCCTPCPDSYFVAFGVDFKMIPSSVGLTHKSVQADDLIRVLSTNVKNGGVSYYY